MYYISPNLKINNALRYATQFYITNVKIDGLLENSLTACSTEYALCSSPFTELWEGFI